MTEFTLLGSERCAPRPLRAMWMLLHGQWRRFEVPMLRSIGFEVYVTKRAPDGFAERSASVDFGADYCPTLDADALASIDAVDFYATKPPPAHVRRLVNDNFDIVFLPAMGKWTSIISNFLRWFRGLCVVRVPGREVPNTYTQLLKAELPIMKAAGARFCFSPVFDGMTDVEDPILSANSAVLPIGMPTDYVGGGWTGGGGYVLFVCPDVLPLDAYYGRIYTKFTADFAGLPAIIAGRQPKMPSGSNLLGYVPDNRYKAVMRKASVMFYHSQEPRHCHYHPFEALAMGVPLVYMTGGILDRFGGAYQPGACSDVVEARRKVEALIDDDVELRDAMLRSQGHILKPMLFQNAKPVWQSRMRELL